MNYKKINTITGWIIFGISLVVYVLTLEPTASYWDCGEFIAASYKLEVVHPPGAPLFLLIGRIFSFLSFGDTTKVAYWINFSSALSSAFTILFLFWTITMLGRKLLRLKNGDGKKSQNLAIIGAGIIGALAYTFSDTFWFSAVEAEVYAMSSFFTAFVFWAILKWELIEDEVYANRWLLMIAFMIGLSIGVHLLNLVCLPALGLIYYFKKFKNPTRTGIIVTLVVSAATIILINNGIIVGLPVLAGKFEVFFVNGLGLPFGSGALAFTIILLGGLAYGIYYSIQKGRVVLNTALLSLAFILIGYSVYTMVLIRSNYNPPIDQNNPEDVMAFISYLKREQYGETPSLIYGRYFTAQPIATSKGAPIYAKGEDKYDIIDYRTEVDYDPEHMTLFPRAWSTEERYVERYRQWMNLKPGEKPTFIDNLGFFFRYQIGHSYLRYFMWNFAGRESDIQDAGWQRPWDAFEEVPHELAVNNGRNNYFMLPLILGLIGVFFHYKNQPKDFAVVTLLFLFTGLALVVYLNIPSSQPRERDYIYVGSYYAFAIWIGLGTMALSEFLSKYIKKEIMAPIIATIICFAVPLIMAAENWDDHDRSNRYFSVDSAKNFLASCAPNSILFTGGDNDTFPLWYVQEVEGFRTDMRVIVQSYFNTDWYVHQMTRQAYESEPLPFSLEYENYRQGKNDYLQYVQTSVKGPINARTFLKLIKEENPALQRTTSSGTTLSIVPARKFFLSVDTAAVLDKGIIPENLKEFLVDRMEFEMRGSYLGKGDLMALDLIVNNNWERPIYFNTTSLRGINFNLEDYVVQEGNAYRLLPLKKPSNVSVMVNTEVMYDNLMNNFFYRNLNDPSVNYSDQYRSFVYNLRSSFNTLAQALIDEGKPDKALEVIKKCLEVAPDESVPYDVFVTQMVGILAQLGEEEMVVDIGTTLGERANEALEYQLENNVQSQFETRNLLVTLRQVSSAFKQIGNDELALEYENYFKKHLGQLQ